MGAQIRTPARRSTTTSITVPDFGKIFFGELDDHRPVAAVDARCASSLARRTAARSPPPMSTTTGLVDVAAFREAMKLAVHLRPGARGGGERLRQKPAARLELHLTGRADVRSTRRARRSARARRSGPSPGARSIPRWAGASACFAARSCSSRAQPAEVVAAGGDATLPTRRLRSRLRAQQKYLEARPIGGEKPAGRRARMLATARRARSGPRAPQLEIDWLAGQLEMRLGHGATPRRALTGCRRIGPERQGSEDLQHAR